MILLIIVAAFLPLLNILTAYVFRPSDKWLSRLAATTVSVSATLMLYAGGSAWIGQKHWFVQTTWFSMGQSLVFRVGLNADTMALMMLSIILFVSALVHWFSGQYMKGDGALPRYFSALALFTCAMNGLVLSDNLITLFMCWELVGFASYLLIGFWYTKDSASNAAKKAFLVNRIGDAGLLTGIFTCWANFGTVSLTEINQILQANTQAVSAALLLVAGLGFLLACAGKSAQFPLQIWLPDAMEGPTPVSALIHAATMVTAGIYLLVRTYAILPPLVLHLAVLMGCITMLIAALTATRQTDIKRVLAFSTISQLGYMVVAIGVGAPQAAMFHLLTHAFFKAGLFLCAGSVIHALHDLAHRAEQWGQEHAHFDAQDMRLMGGLRKALPFTFVAYTAAAAALAGVPFLSGFLSKESILLATVSWAQHSGLWLTWLVPAVLLFTASLTTFYMMRQWYLVFWGEFRLEKHWHSVGLLQKVKEVPLPMRAPTLMLAALSTFVVFSPNPLDGSGSWFWQGHSPAHVEGHGFVLAASLLAALIGFCVACTHYGLKVAMPLAKKTNQLLENQFYLNQIYQKIIIAPVHRLANFTTQKSLQRFFELTVIKPLLYCTEQLAYIDKHKKYFVGTLFINPVLKMSAAVAYFDEKRVSGSVDIFSKIVVVFAHVIGFIDRFLVDGTIHLLVWAGRTLGGVFRSPQNGNVQQYVWYALGLLVLWLSFWIM